MSAFSGLESLMLATSQRLFGERCGINPMTPAGGRPNGAIASDPSREPLTGVPVVRSEWSGQVETGDNGMGRSAGAFRVGVNAVRHIATLHLADLAWRPRPHDELVYESAPAERWKVAEILPDGGAGLRLVLNRVS
ncbi:head-tail attachment [Microcystis phage vB_MweS-yong2]|nr:head-tail attachment [Microcystis phage vB_MweS-yong2]